MGSDQTRTAPSLKLWHLDGGEIETLYSERGAIYQIALSPDGQTIAAACAEGAIVLWHRDGRRLQTLTGHEDAVVGIAFSPDWETIASAS
ncbi:MAG: hypothetical protein SWY16_12275 [Cyanobacteriota bacterium]|nr:hypothetical protein [Cyanobacteriota bacterium]